MEVGAPEPPAPVLTIPQLQLQRRTAGGAVRFHRQPGERCVGGGLLTRLGQALGDPGLHLGREILMRDGVIDQRQKAGMTSPSG